MLTFKRLLLTFALIGTYFLAMPIGYAYDAPFPPREGLTGGQQSAFARGQNNQTTNQTQNTNQSAQNAPSVVIVPSEDANKQTKNLFNKSEFNNFDKQKKETLFQIPTLQE